MSHLGVLRTDLAGLSLRNPVILAAGTAGVLDEMSEVLDLAKVGAVVTKSITRHPREGHEGWRVAELPGGIGMINAVGLANPGIDAFLQMLNPDRGGGSLVRGGEREGATLIGSVAGFSINDYVQVAGCMDDSGALAGVELNVSCPNVQGGTEFGASPASLGELVRQVRRVVTRTTLLVKLSPIAVGEPGIVPVARAAVEGGADVLCIGNTMPAMSIDVATQRPRLGNGSGGLSGPALRPIAVKLVHDVYRKVARDAGVPIVGVGGVMRWRDAAEFVLAGASAVQMGTALFADVRAPLRVIEGLARWVRRQGSESIAQLIGAVRMD